MKRFPKNVHIDENVHIHHGVIFLLPDCAKRNLRNIIKIKSGTTIRHGAILYGPCTIDENCTIDHFVIIREGTHVGANTRLMNRTELGTDVKIGTECRISGYAASRSFIGDKTSMFGSLIHKYEKHRGGLIEASPTVGSNVLIGWNALVVGGIYIGNRSIVKAHSIVTKDLEADSAFP